MEHIIHLSKDKKLKKVMAATKPYRLTKRKNVCLRLCASIMSQQLSTRVAEVIYRRFLELYDRKEPSAEQVLNTPTETLRAIGLSNAKVSYVHNVARFAIEQGMDEKKLRKMSNEEIIEYLTQIKGVGQWTVEMILMFTLGREDVFAADDLGIQVAMAKLYKLDRENKKKLREDMLRISSSWSPYRTYGCLYLWRWKDRKKSTDNGRQTKSAK
jgi:DNA-3-methyladenine glycosylase II